MKFVRRNESTIGKYYRIRYTVFSETHETSRGGGGGGGTPIYGLYRYVPRDRVWFLRFSVIIFAPFGIVFPVLSLDRVPKFYQLK